MLGETLSLNLGGSGGTAVVLSRINQDAYSSEYLKKRVDDEVRVRIKNAKDTVKAGSQPFDRHVVTFEQFVYPTTAKPQGVLRSVTMTIRNSPADLETDVTNLGEALTFWATPANLTALFGWQS